MPLSDFRHSHRIRVRYGECDYQGVVFNGRYLDYGDIALTEYFRAAGMAFGQDDSMEFHVVRAEVDFRKPVRPDELIDLWTRTERAGNTSLTLLTEVHGARDDGAEDLRAVIREVQVHVDLATHTPVSIPEAVKARFLAFDTRADAMLTGERG